MDLLNAIFGGFHTVKGGAGFLQLHTLVECCNIAENVFDILRKGERRVDAELMDVVLQALDSVNEMFGQVREREEPTPASPNCWRPWPAWPSPPAVRRRRLRLRPWLPLRQWSRNRLGRRCGGRAGIERCRFPESARCPGQRAERGSGNAGSRRWRRHHDDEFEALLDQLHGKGKFQEAPAAAQLPLRPCRGRARWRRHHDDEFEALLDDCTARASSSPAKPRHRRCSPGRSGSAAADER